MEENKIKALGYGVVSFVITSLFAATANRINNNKIQKSDIELSNRLSYDTGCMLGSYAAVFSSLPFAYEFNQYILHNPVNVGLMIPFGLNMMGGLYEISRMLFKKNRTELLSDLESKLKTINE